MQALEVVKAGLQPEEYPLKAEDHEAPDTVVPLFLTYYRITESQKPIYLKLNPDVSATSTFQCRLRRLNKFLYCQPVLQGLEMLFELRIVLPLLVTMLALRRAGGQGGCWR